MSPATVFEYLVSATFRLLVSFGVNPHLLQSLGYDLYQLSCLEKKE